MIGYLILGVVIMLQALIHYCERKDLYDRVMSKNFTEYKGGNIPRYHISAHENVLKRWRNKGGDNK